MFRGNWNYNKLSYGKSRAKHRLEAASIRGACSSLSNDQTGTGNHNRQHQSESLGWGRAGKGCSSPGKQLDGLGAKPRNARISTCGYRVDAWAPPQRCHRVVSGDRIQKVPFLKRFEKVYCFVFFLFLKR